MERMSRRLRRIAGEDPAVREAQEHLAARLAELEATVARTAARHDASIRDAIADLGARISALEARLTSLEERSARDA